MYQNYLTVKSRGKNMNTQGPKSSKDPNQSSQKPSERRSNESSPNNSSDSSQSYNKPSSEEFSKIYTTEPLDTARISDNDAKSSESKKDNQSSEGKNRQDHPKKVDELYDYARSNKEQTITYILLALGLLFLLFFNNLLGGLIIGMVAGYYFAAEIVYYIRNIGQIIGGQDQLRYVVLTALLLGLFIAAPGIFIGAAIVAAFKQVMAGPNVP
jgi:hypothetical protein